MYRYNRVINPEKYSKNYPENIFGIKYKNVIDLFFAMCEYLYMTPKSWRKQQKMTLEQLSNMIGFSQGHLSEIENGKKNGSAKLVNAYYRISGGQVTANDFFHQNI